MPIIIIPVQYNTQNISENNHVREKIKRTCTGKEIKLSLLEEDMTLYIEVPKTNKFTNTG